MKLWGGRFTKETNQLVHNFNASISFDREFDSLIIEKTAAGLVIPALFMSNFLF